MFGVPYTTAATIDQLRTAITSATQSILIEVPSDRDQNVTSHKALQEQLRAALDS
jgi:2-succinyl-5-enolpyruvyl-6-hydroxy-3-cyclohexene-1-carboxylate synthase